MKPVWISLFNLLSCSCFVSGTHLCGICRECLAKSSVIQEGTRGGPKNNRSYFLKWFIRFYTITTLVSFKVFSFWLDTLLPTFFPLLKTFMELFSADVVQDFSVFFFTSLASAKFFPFIWPFIWGNRKKLHGAKSGEWIGRMRDNRHVVFLPKTIAHSRLCGQGHCCGEGTNHRCSTFLVVFSVHYRLIFSAPSNKVVDSQCVQEDQIPCKQFH